MHRSQCGTRLAAASGSRPWLKWIILAVLLMAVGAGMLLAQKLGRFSHPAHRVPGAVPAGTGASRDAVSDEDRARAAALVGPQGRDLPAAPAVQEAPAPAAADAAPARPPMSPPATADQPAAMPGPHLPPPSRPQPTLDDLLD